MKRIARGMAAVLTAALMLSCVAFASGSSENPTVTPADSATTVAFNSDCTSLELTYTNTAIEKDGLYLVMVVKDDGTGSYVPTDSTLLYVNEVQAAAAGTVTFTNVYPKEIANSAILISGTGLSAPVVVATIQMPYTLGDVNDDGDIGIPDASLVLQHIAEITELTGNELLAANTDGVEGIGVNDAILILQLIAGIIGKL